MKMPTSMAPHIWCHVRRKASAYCVGFMPSSRLMMNHDARIAEPPIKGAKEKAAATVAP